MTAARNRKKQQNRDIHKALANVELAATQKESRQSQQRQHAKNLFAMANLVFGGIFIGGIFQDVANPFLLYAVGLATFAILYMWGSILLKKSVI